MEYNTTRNKLRISQYGRNIQMMIESLHDIEDREKRTRMAHTIVDVMAQLNPDIKETSDLKHSLWDHLYIISNFTLDVDAPYPAPEPETLTSRPERLSYGHHKVRYRHYGRNIEQIIKVIGDFPDGKEKDMMTRNIANHLKKSYLNWNRDSVNDELIVEHLNVLSDGKLALKEDDRLFATNDILSRNRPKKKLQQPRNNSHRQRRK